MEFLLELLIDLLLGFEEKLQDRFTYQSETTERVKIIAVVAAICLMFVYAAYLAFRGWQEGDSARLFLGCILFALLMGGGVVIAWRHRKG